MAERLRVRLLRALADDLHVRLHRRGIGVDLHHRHVVARVVDVFVERDQPWLAGLDELDEPGTRSRSRWSCPALSRLVAMKMNGEGIAAPRPLIPDSSGFAVPWAP